MLPHGSFCSRSCFLHLTVFAFSSPRLSLLAFLLLEMTSALLGISAPMVPAIPFPVLLDPTPLRWVWRQRISVSSVQRGGTAIGQACPICPRHRCVVQGKEMWSLMFNADKSRPTVLLQTEQGAAVAICH